MTPITYPETEQGMLEHLKQRLADAVPAPELRIKAEIAVAINRKKHESKAIILGHNYMEPALFHSVPDYTGDSLGLSRIAASADCEIIIFCGVRFMAETAKILNPNRMVLLPSPKGGCSLAEAITAEDVRALRQRYPRVPVVTYVNTYADVKAESDYCCTSGNGAAVVRHLQAQGHDQIIFLPDQFLASNVAQETGAQIIVPTVHPPVDAVTDASSVGGRTIIGFTGRCEVHERFTVDDINQARAQFSDVVILAHPECSPEVVEAADFAGSTEAMIRYVKGMTSGRYLLLTECSMGDNIVSQNPEREMLRLCSIRCPHMNEITLDETLAALQQRRYEIEVDSEISARASRALKRMIAIG